MTNTTTPSLVDEALELLKTSVGEVFGTMFNMKARPEALRDFRGRDEAVVAGSVGFIGDVNGVVYVYMADAFARRLACRMLGMSEAELEGDEMVNDVIGELTNMIVGAVKSRLCDSGAPCVLTIPSIVRGRNLSAQPAGSSECHLLSILCDGEPILVELLMKKSK
jgi:chemotaxis protein CheX